ncbi:hypothetical protein SAMN05216350_10149 [Polaromonas sp. YR568]|uniref:hypothetical protein n=1 Tax=Polaromonas sp. YR568 TaxID=1855301 RepID=UPI0008E0C05C|nr:hypothetical protein [Polaromonas sp. YR568]SFU28019.1 hypothetical protein SAMN05216350_10149 [Polaromonas sp. YR568]
MHTTKLPDAMDITRYLQTEGRRVAAELGRRRAPDPTAARQQQCAAPSEPNPPRSLSEALQRMGVVSPPRRRL